MPLAATVAPLGAGQSYVPVHGQPGVPLLCHNATAIWLFRDEFGRLPGVMEVADLGGTTALVKAMLPLGRPFTQSSALAPGTVLVFVRGGEPGHSCVATTATTLGGYNQTDWFSGPGQVCRYTTHHVTEIVWRPGGKEASATASGSAHSVVAVPEGSAKAIVRQAAQRNMT